MRRAFLFFLLFVTAPAAADEPWVTFGGALEVEVNLERNGRRDQVPAFTDAYTKSELAAYAILPAGFTANGVFKLEPTGLAEPGDDRFFDDHTLWVDELYLSWGSGPLILFGGKLHPRFGFAWDRGPGEFGTDFCEEYELTEKIGGGAELSLSDLAGLTGSIGQHSLRAEFFHADTSVLSTGAFARRFSTGLDDPARRWRNSQSLGGADNTDDLGNFALSLAGVGTPMPIGMLDYTIGYSSRGAGIDARDAGAAATEHGYVVGVAWEIPLPERVTLTPLVEGVRLENYGGFDGVRNEYLTAGFEVERVPWRLAYAYQFARLSDPSAADTRAVRVENTASITYDLSNHVPVILRGLEWSIGWRRLRDAGVSTNDFGTQLVWGYTF
jgi:hypothetical protein